MYIHVYPTPHDPPSITMMIPLQIFYSLLACRHVYIVVLSCSFLKLSAQTSDKEVALQQIALLRGQIQEYQQSVQELEAAKEQLEENAFTTNSSLQQLEAQHKQVCCT